MSGPSSTPQKFNLVRYLSERVTAATTFTAPAIFFRGEWVGFEQIFDRAARFAGLLAASGVRVGDRVALVMQDCPQFFYSFLGAIQLGAIAVPISTNLPPAELEFILGNCGAVLLIATVDQRSKIDTIRPRLSRLREILWLDLDNQQDFDSMLKNQREVPPADTEPSTPAFILYTSGSTGNPKGAVHAHNNIPYTIETACAEILRITPGDLLYSSSRLFFAYGLGNSLSSCLGFGARVVLCDEKPTVQVIREIFTSSRPTVFFGVPSVYRALLSVDKHEGLERDSASLRLCVSAGERLPEKLVTQWSTATRVEVLDAIGSTEMLHIFISNRSGEVVPGSSGRPISGYGVKLLDDEGHAINGPGHGNLWVSGGSAMLGYWENDPKTLETVIDGWISTGDLYRRDEGGYYWHEGRRDDIFKVKGLWVSPLEVEDALLSHPGVAEAAVVPGFDDQGLNIAIAYVVAGGTSSLAATEMSGLIDHCRGRLPAYKCPAEVRLVDQLPRTATGKLQRFKLRSN